MNKLGPEELFKTIFERLPLASFSCDAEGVVVDWNEAAERLYGYKRQDAVGCKIVELIATPDSNDEDLIRQVFSGEELTGIKLRRRCADGRRLEVLTTFCPLRETQGKVGRVVLVESKTADFSGAERMRVQEALRESEERFRQLAENIKEVFWLTDWINNKVLYVSPAYEEIWGCSPQSLLDNSRSWIYNIHPDDRDRVYNSFKQNAEIGLYDEIYRVVPKDGEIRWIHDRAFPIHDETGRVWRVVGISEDITDIKRAEEALRESEEKHRSLVERANDGIAIVQNSLLKYVNPRLAQMLGYTCEEMINTSFTHYMDTAELPKVADRYKRRMAGEDVPSIYETIVRHKDGSRIYVELNVGIVTYKGKPAEFVFVRDVTERKLAEEKVKRHSQELSTLLEVTTQVSATLDEEEVTRLIAQRATELIGADGCTIYRFDPQTEMLIPGTTTILQDREQRLAYHISLGEGITGKAALERRPILANNVHLDDKAIRIPGVKETPRCLLVAPLVAHGELWGVMTLVRLSEEGFREHDLELFGLFANQVADAAVNSSLFSRLSESEEKYRSFVEQAIDGIVIIQDARIVFANRAAANLGGYALDDLVGMEFQDLVAPKLRDEMLDRYRRRMAGQQVPSVYETKLLARDAQVLDVELNAGVIHYERRLADLVFIRDIAERKRAEEALRKSERKYHQLVDSLHEGIWVIDKDSCTTFINPRMAQMLGYTPDEMQGKHLFSFMDERGVQICKRYLERRRQGIKEQHEFEFLKKDGTRIYTLLETSPITDDDGGYMGAVAGVLDITERKLATEALRESEELYRTLVNSAEEGICLVDSDERFLFVNPKLANLVGYDQEELIGRSLLELVPSEEVEFIRSESRRRMKGETSRYETILIHKNGTPRKVLVNAAPIYDAEGQLYATLGVLTDITDLKKVEDELRLRLIYQTAFAQIMNRAIGIENLDTFIQACLEILGNALDASRVYLATDREVSKQGEEVHPSAPKEGPGARVTHEWLGQGAETLLGTDYSYSKIGYIHKHLKDDEAIAALVSSLPEADSRVFRDQGALSVILAPLRLRNGFYGFIVAEEYRVARQWSNSETEAFRTAARLIGTVIDRYFEEQERRVAEEARAQSEQRYRTLVETSSDIIFLLSPSGKPLYGSPAIERMGYKPEDILREPKAFFKAIAPDDFMMLQALFAKALREGKPIHDIDCKVYDSQGSSHWFAVSWNFIRDDEGRILAVQGVARDITERKQAERALRLRMEYEKVLFEISSLFLSEGVSDSSLGEFLERLARVTEVSRVYLFFHEEENSRPFMKHIHRWVSEEASELDNDRMDKVYYDQGFERWLKILSTGEAIHGLTDDLPASELEVFEAEGILAILVLPIFVEGRFWGAIGFDEVKRRREWNVEDIRLLWTASKILSSALATESKARELALSYENLQERERRISELNLRLVKAEEDERRRIARVLHDEIAQQLTGVSLVLSAPELTRESRAKERLDEAKGLVKETQNFIRDLSYELLPPALENLGLAAAVRALARSAAEGSGVSFVIQGDEGFPRADPDTEIMLYRVIQEAVTNALKHAEPDEITVRFEYAEPTFRVMVEDDGKGFDVEKVASASSGLGLRSIHERVALIGGRIELNSSVGKGTQVLIEVEIPRNSDKLSVEE
ncbi:MAG: PAS domain S-box protein [Candidatus Stahlbacteria bacterium]|nr:MAG: PAS domain S-box protein [Candidatus Stahlbacteria bacterium]